MKKLALSVIVFFIWCSIAMAVTVPPGAYIGCDPDPAADQYIVEINGTQYGPMAPVKVKPLVTVIMEIGSLLVAESLYIIRAKAVNIFGEESDWTPPFEFYFSGAGTYVTHAPPGEPSMMRLWTKE